MGLKARFHPEAAGSGAAEGAGGIHLRASLADSLLEFGATSSVSFSQIKSRVVLEVWTIRFG